MSHDNGSCTNNMKSKCKSKEINLSTVTLSCSKQLL